MLIHTTFNPRHSHLIRRAHVCAQRVMPHYLTVACSHSLAHSRRRGPQRACAYAVSVSVRNVRNASSITPAPHAPTSNVQSDAN